MAMLTASADCEWIIAAMKAVMVVPMFAPRINGTTSRNETTFFAAIGTTSEVVTVLDRIAAVVTSPQKNDLNGLTNTSLLNVSCNRLVRRLVMSLLKTMIEMKRSPKDRVTRRNTLAMLPTRKSITGPKTDIR